MIYFIFPNCLYPTLETRNTHANHNAGPDLLRFRKKEIVGGLTISLKRAVPQTNSTKPTTCSHLKVSQPSPRLTIQMKRVRQVSIVLREVAEMTRVTLRPKKLKPLDTS